jgi:hypothetical protein
VVSEGRGVCARINTDIMEVFNTCKCLYVFYVMFSCIRLSATIWKRISIIFYRIPVVTTVTTGSGGNENGNGNTNGNANADNVGGGKKSKKSSKTSKKIAYGGGQSLSLSLSSSGQSNSSGSNKSGFKFGSRLLLGGGNKENSGILKCAVNMIQHLLILLRGDLKLVLGNIACVSSY